MLAPQALRAVIRVAVAGNFYAAVLADKILPCPNERHLK